MIENADLNSIKALRLACDQILPVKKEVLENEIHAMFQAFKFKYLQNIWKKAKLYLI